MQHSPLKQAGFALGTLSTTAMILAAAPVWSAEVYLNQQCQRVSSETNAYRVDYRRNIQAGGQPYWFSMARYADGGGIFCLTRPNYTQGKLLPFAELKNQFVNEVKQESQETSFLVTIAGGNGFRVPLTLYRLNLANPTRPTLTKLKQWRSQ